MVFSLRRDGMVECFELSRSSSGGDLSQVRLSAQAGFIVLKSKSQSARAFAPKLLVI